MKRKQDRNPSTGEVGRQEDERKRRRGEHRAAFAADGGECDEDSIDFCIDKYVYRLGVRNCGRKERKKIARIGLIDVDGHRFPNLALMRISAYHKRKGDIVEWWWSDFIHYDIVYMSKTFSDVYSKDVPEPINADRIIKGGTGYAITTLDGIEIFDKNKDHDLPGEVEKMFPDYSLYPQYEFAVAMTSRGCPRGCRFCHVAAKEGKCATKVANVSDFWNGQKEIKVLDPNITACPEKKELMRQYVNTGALIDFTQGLDIRLLDAEDINSLNQMRLKELHFAWDNPTDDLEDRFREYAREARHRPHGKFGTVYVLTNFNSTMTENLYRIYVLRDLGFDPYVMVYNKPNAPHEIRMLQRWCNNRIIFRSCKRFEDYRG